jgi:hypothetical protein
MGRGLTTFIRLFEVVTVVGLGFVAWSTYGELQEARRTPVFLPKYEFFIENEAGKGPIVTARGTWIPESGPPEPLQTTTIECRRVRSDCVESSAIIEPIAGRGMLEASQTTFIIDRWTEREIHTQPAAGPCGSRVLVLNLEEKRASAKSTARPGNSRCPAAPERSLELVSGYRVREEARKR